MSNILKTLAAGSATGAYQISRSLRFNSADSAYLNRTPASAGNRKTWTWSGWVKRSELGGGTDATGYRALFSAYSNNSNYISIDYSRLTEGIRFDAIDSAAFTGFETASVYRDVSAWYHVVIAVDTTQATSSNRLKCYVNGVQATFTSSTYPSLNQDYQLNNTVAHWIGGNAYPGFPQHFGGYLTEINFIDGQALTPSSFGEINATTGVWSPIAYAGTYGTNGFYLNFSDNSNVTATTLGKDSSGNGNNWTPNNFSVTAGAGNDSLVDTPTQYGTDTGAGGEVRGNYCTWNPLSVAGAGNTVISDGNLQASYSVDTIHAFSTIPIPSNDTTGWYWEIVVTTMDTLRTYIGVVDPSDGPATVGASYEWNTDSLLRSNGQYFNAGSGGSPAATYTSYAANDVVMVAYKDGKIWFGKNGVWMNSGDPAAGTGQIDTLSTSKSWHPYVGYRSTFVANFGQRPFSYTAPSGFKALVTTNLPDPTVVQGDDYFNTVLYTGNSSSQSITGVGFQPDLVWTKSRSQAYYNSLNDAVRGAGQSLSSNVTDAELNYSAYFSSFDSDGFTLPTASNVYNSNFETYVAWNWKANGAGVSNTDGTITSTVSANQTAGISIVTYTGNGTAGATVGHGLGAVPKMFILKERNGSGAADFWATYHVSLGNTQYLTLNTTNAVATAPYWNNTTPTSSVITLGSNTNINDSGGPTYLIYAFAEVPGFSAFGSYTGNGSTDGAFVYTGFRPAYLLIKSSNLSGVIWIILDTKRNTSNVASIYLRPDSSQAEATFVWADILSNGFKLRTTDTAANGNGSTYIYAAIAEFPFRNSLAR